LQQIVDLQEDAEYQSLGVQLLSIAFDSPAEVLPHILELGITIPMLTDVNQDVSADYDVLQWAVATGEPGHTFILVDVDGNVAWIQDYGAPENRGVMYVDPTEISEHIRASIEG
jgi:alkyl hydroperoxide reductase subunit AhpC